ncbi:MAG: hypothetical protein ACOC2U_01225 [bacterium]
MYFYGSNLNYLDTRVKSFTKSGVLLVKDEERQFSKMNSLTDSEMLNTFVTDKNNKVLLMGNPVLNKQLGQLYLKLIKGKIEN